MPLRFGMVGSCKKRYKGSTARCLLCGGVAREVVKKVWMAIGVLVRFVYMHATALASPCFSSQVAAFWWGRTRCQKAYKPGVKQSKVR